MISPKFIGATQLDRVLLGVEKLPQGFYFAEFKEEEDSGWIHYTTYRYYLDGFNHPSWCLDISGKTIFMSILFGRSALMEASKEDFLNHVREISPEVMDWVLFNLDSL